MVERCAHDGRRSSGTGGGVGLLEQAPGRGHGVEGGHRRQEPAFDWRERSDVTVTGNRSFYRFVVPTLESQDGLGNVEERRPYRDPVPAQETRELITLEEHVGGPQPEVKDRLWQRLFLICRDYQRFGGRDQTLACRQPALNRGLTP